MAQNNPGMIGVDIDAVHTASSSLGAGSKFTVGTEYKGGDGNLYRYVQAAAAISTTLNEPVMVTISTADQALVATSVTARAIQRIGWAPRQIIAQWSYFWARISGTFSIRVAAAAAADSSLGLPGGVTTGRLASWVASAASSVRIIGVKITLVGSTSASAGNTIRTALVTNAIAVPD